MCSFMYIILHNSTGYRHQRFHLHRLLLPTERPFPLRSFLPSLLLLFFVGIFSSHYIASFSYYTNSLCSYFAFVFLRFSPALSVRNEDVSMRSTLLMWFFPTLVQDSRRQEQTKNNNLKSRGTASPTIFSAHPSWRFPFASIRVLCCTHKSFSPTVSILLPQPWFIV